MSWHDFKSKVPIAHFTLTGAAETRQWELSILQNKLAGANMGIRAIDILFSGSIASTGAGYWIDVLNAKLTNITLIKGGERIWDIGSRNQCLLQMQRLGYYTTIGADVFTTATWHIMKSIRCPFLDDAFIKAKDDGLVPARALNDATLQLTFAADAGAYPMTGVTVWIFAEVYGLHEHRPTYTMERVTDKINLDTDALTLQRGRQYDRLFIVNPPNRSTTYNTNDYANSVFNVSADNTFVQNLTGQELQDSFMETNPYVDDVSSFSLHTEVGDHMLNTFQPILWPGRDGWQGEYMSKAYPAFFKPLTVELTFNAAGAGSNPHALPVPLVVTWIPTPSDNDMDATAGQQGLLGRARKVRTATKTSLKGQAEAGVAGRILPTKVVGSPSK